MKKIIIAAVAAALASTTALAAVSFDQTTGTGFVGKGDVQLAFGWNNAAAQRNASGVSFTYATEDSYSVTCEWDTVTGGKNSKTIHHAVTNTKTSSVTSAIASDPRKTGQYTGYNLNGLGITTVVGQAAPEVGDSCPQGGSASDSDPAENDAVVTAVEMESSEGGLYVNYGGSSVLLSITPTV